MITDPVLVRDLLCTAPMPHVAAASVPGIAWLRAHVPRFCDGPDHDRRRAIVQAELHLLDPADLRRRVAEWVDRPLAQVRVLLAAMSLPDHLAEDVAVVAATYQPHEPITPAADAAVVTLVRSMRSAHATDRGDDEAIAARICLLVQACGATAELIAAAAAYDTGAPADRPAVIMATTPPLRSTRRVVDGTVTELDLRHPGLGFGAGPHRCPGSAHALAIAGGLLAAMPQPGSPAVEVDS